MKKQFTVMDWMRRANDAALGGGAEITPEPAIDSDQEWLDWMDSRHVSDWTDEELARYSKLTGQKSE